MFAIDTIAAISCVPPVNPSFVKSIMLNANDGKSYEQVLERFAIGGAERKRSCNKPKCTDLNDNHDHLRTPLLLSEYCELLVVLVPRKECLAQNYVGPSHDKRNLALNYFHHVVLEYANASRDSSPCVADLYSRLCGKPPLQHSSCK